MSTREDKLEELLKELKKVYYSEVREYRRCLNTVAQDLAHVLAQEAVRHLPITARVKAWDSICGTAKRRQGDRLAAQAVRDKMTEQGWKQHCDRYKISATDLGYFQSRDELKRAFHDMLGARIILYFPSDAGKVLRLLDDAGYVCDRKTKRMGGLEDPGRLRKLHEKLLDASASPSAHPADDLNLDGSGKQFSGYGAIHMVVKVPERLQPRDLEPEAKAVWEACVVEIQTGTIMMHAWAEVEHDITYKSHGREVSQDEKGLLDMLNGLALASEVGMGRFRSPPVSESPATELEEEVRSWLHQLYIKNMWSTPSDWVDVDLLRDFLVDRRENRRHMFLPLAEAACSTLREEEDKAGLNLDHLLPHVIMHNCMPASPDECPPPPPPPPALEFCAECSGPLRLSAQETRPPSTAGPGTDEEAEDQYGQALSWAAGNGNMAVVKLLLDAGRVDADWENDEGRTPLSRAAENGDEDIVKLLLDTGRVDADSKDVEGRTPLSWAAEEGNEAVVELLLAVGGVDVDSEDYSGRTPLSWAVARKRNEAVVELLLNTGRADAGSQDDSGRTPLTWAAQTGDAPTVKLLLETGGVDVDLKTNMGQTPLACAAEYEHEAVVKLLLDTGRVDADSKDVKGRTPLTWAVEMRNEALVKLLLDTGRVNVEWKGWQGRTPLSWAAERGNEAVVKLLLGTGKVNVDSKDVSGQTPLSWAAKGGWEDVVKLLLDTGRADINSTDDQGFTALTWAQEHGHLDLSGLLRSYGAAS